MPAGALLAPLRWTQGGGVLVKAASAGAARHQGYIQHRARIGKLLLQRRAALLGICQ
jgi:hypothetical protein